MLMVFKIITCMYGLMLKLYFTLFYSKIVFFRTYDWLSRHYRDKHYLCEEGNCINEQYTSVFRTSIDLQGNNIV